MTDGSVWGALYENRGEVCLILAKEMNDYTATHGWLDEWMDGWIDGSKCVGVTPVWVDG